MNSKHYNTIILLTAQYSGDS